jgi:hypothetical protein
MDAEGLPVRESSPAAAGSTRRIVQRVALLLLTAVSLYILFPSLVDVFSSWRSLSRIDPVWAPFILLAEAASFAATWELQRVALHRRGWFDIPLAQLAANAAGRIIPGGGATAGAFELGLLQRAGLPVGRSATALAAATALQFAALLALPVFALPVVLAGAPVDHGLSVAAYLGAGVLVLLLAGGAIAFATERPLRLGGRSIQWVLNHTVRRKRRVRELGEKLIAERDFIRATLSEHWLRAVASAVAVPAFDYLALLCALRSIGVHARPSLVLLAYVAAALLGMIPLTPGGLGFVEAGLVGLLTLAGVSAADAVTATLVYRLVSFWLPIPIGGVAYLVFLHRYRTRPADALPGPA